MHTKFKPLDQQVIVITGASSGIGLATARMAAAKGAKLVLSARNEPALAQITADLMQKGATVTYVAGDIGQHGTSEKIAAAAHEKFGGFDTWVNNAGVGLAGKLVDLAEADMRRVLETNFWGTLHGSIVALKTLSQRGGKLINVGSEVSEVAFPVLGIYAASKHAVKGFTNALRMEIEHDKLPVSVTLIKPAAIGTPFFESMKNITGKAPKAPPPVYKAEEVAHAILFAATHHRRDISVGSASRLTELLYVLSPRLVDLIGSKAGFKMQLQDKPAPPHADNLYQAGSHAKTVGAYTGHPRISLYTRLITNPPLLVAVVAIIIIGGYVLSR